MRESQLKVFRVFCLGVIVFLAHFSKMKHFGFYEEDFLLIAPFLKLSWAEALQQFQTLLHTYQDGRPLHFYIPAILTYLTYSWGGLLGLYSIAFGILWLNAWMMFRVLSEVTDDLGAWLGAVSFTLLPMDTTREFLTHAFTLQISLFLVLASIRFYLRGSLKVSYLFALLPLLIYEAPFLMLFTLPFFSKQKKDRIEFIRHFAILTLIASACLVLRHLSRESRVEGLLFHTELSKLTLRVLSAPWIGLWVGIKLIFHRCFEVWSGTLKYSNFFLGFGLFLFALIAAKNPSKRVGVQFTFGKLIAFGGMLILTSYLSAFLDEHYPPIVTHGKAISVHYSSIVGWSMIIGALFLPSLKTRVFTWGRVALMGFLMVSLFVFSLSVQEDYAKQWAQTRIFWSQTLPLINDAADGDVILVSCTHPESCRGQYIESLDACASLVLDELFEKPPQWELMPGLFPDHVLTWMFPGVVFGPQGFEFQGPDSAWVHVSNEHIIALNYDARTVSRVSSTKSLSHLKLSNGAHMLNELKRKPLYDLLISKGDPQ